LKLLIALESNMKDLIEQKEIILSEILKNKEICLSSTQLSQLSKYNKKDVNKKIRDMFGDEIAREMFSLSFRENGQIDEYYLPETESVMFAAKWNMDFLRIVSQFWVDEHKAILTKETLALEIKNSEQIAEIESGYSVSQYEKDREISNLEKIINQYSSAEDFKDPRKVKRMPLIFKVHGKTLHLGMCNKSEALKWKSKFREFVNETDEMDIHKIRDLFYVQETRKHFVPYHSCLDQ